MRPLLLTTITLLLAAHQGWAAPQDALAGTPADYDYDYGTVAGGVNRDICPRSDGFYPDPLHCDRYYECVDYVPTEKICPDGQAFKDDNPKREVCEYLFNVKCGSRTELQTAQVSPNCPRANGYFAHPDETNCREFYFCVKGEGAHNSCPAGLHFSKASGNCGWIFNAGRTGCRKEISPNGFECPVVHDRLKAVAHPRYPNPDDCKQFYVCFNAQGPARDSGCDLGLVFDIELEACQAPSGVKGCENYYDGYFSDYFNNLFGAPADDTHLQVAAFLGIEIPQAARKKPLAEKKIFKGPGRQRSTTTTPEPEYVYYDDSEYYYYDYADNSTTTTTTTTTTPRPTRRRVPGGVRRRRPVKAARPQPEDVVEASPIVL